MWSDLSQTVGSTHLPKPPPGGFSVAQKGISLANSSFEVTIGVDKSQLEEGFDSSAASGQTWSERLQVIFGDAAGSSKRAFASISDDAKEMAANVTPEQLKVAEASQALSQAKADERNATKLAQNGSMEDADAKALQAAAIARVAEATRNLKEAQSAATPKAADVSEGANAVVSDFAGGEAAGEASRAVAAATIADVAAKTELKAVTEALAVSTLDEAEKEEALAAAQDHVRETTAALAEAQAVLRSETQAAAEALEAQRIEAAANAAVQERSAASIATPAQLRFASASLESAAAQKALRAAQEEVESSTLSETEKAAALAPVLDRARIATLELAEAEELLSGASHHAVTDVQATSAAIRSLEGNGGIRAVEQFAAKTLGLGPLMNAIFPVVGALAFGSILLSTGEKIYEVEQKAVHAADETGRAFETLHEKAVVNIDDLTVQNDKLQDELDKLSGHPNNGLQTALDEAKKSADKLLESLRADRKEMESIFKEHEVGAVVGFLGGMASTEGTEKDIMASQQRLTEAFKAADREYEQTVAGSNDTAVIRAAAERKSKARRDALDAEKADNDRKIATIKKDAAEELAAYSGVSGAGEVSIVSEDHSKEQKDREGYAQVLSDRRAEMSLQDSIESRTAAVGAAKQDKAGDKGDDSAARKAAEAARKADEAYYKEVEDGLAKLRMLGPVSEQDQLEYWQSAIQGFSVGSDKYHQILQKEGELTQAILRKVHEEIAKQKATDRKMDEEGSAAILKSDEGMARWTAEINADLTRTGARWTEYWKDVTKGQEISAQINEQIALGSLKALEAAGGISALGAAQQEAAIHAEEHRLKLQALREELARLEAAAPKDALTGNVEDPKQAAQIAQVKNQITQEQGSSKVQGIGDQSAIQMQMAQPWKAAFQTIGNDFQSLTRSILTGQKTIGAGFAEMGRSMALDVIGNIEKMTLKWLEHEALTLVAHNAGNTAKVVSDATAAGTSDAINHKSHMSEIFGDAKTAAAGAYKAMAGIPIVGPELGAVAAGVTFAGVMALASFDVGTAYVPHDGIAMIHKGESILPPPQTQVLQDALGGKGGSRASSITQNFGGNTFHGHGGEDFASQLDTHEDALAWKMAGLMRDRHPAFQS